MDAKYYEPTKLIEARELMGKSQQNIADELNIDRQTVYRAEKGTAVSYETLAALCLFYRIPITTILKPFPETTAV